MDAGLQNQAIVLGRYLVGSRPTDEQIQLFTTALSSQNIGSISATSTLAAALRKPSLLPYLDAYDALFNPNSELRQRAYLLFSILEASTDFVDEFLPQKKPRWYLMIIGLVGIKAVIKTLIGLLIVTLRGLK